MKALRSLVIMVAALFAASAPCASRQQQPAATMWDLQAYFATCFQPPHEAEGTRITFYFSLRSDGAIFGRPRVVWFGYGGSQDDRKRFVSGFRNAFNQCLPLQLNAEMARTIPGKVYFLQFIVGTEGATQVLLRPYGSMGDPLVDVPENF